MAQDTTRRVTVVGTVSGAAHAGENNDIFAALESQNKGATAPPNPEQGLLWLDDSAGTTWTLKIYDGTDWIDLFSIDTTGNTSTPSGSSGGDPFPAGTRMLFQQTAAPTGWTKQTAASLNNSAIRITTGTVTAGGGDDFSTVFGASKVTGGHALTIAEMPAHNHPGGDAARFIGGDSGSGAGSGPITSGGTVGSQGSGSAHDHDLTMDLKFNDVIVASKDA